MPSSKSAGVRGEYAFIKDQRLEIRFTHVPSGKKATFLGALTNFKDAYTSTWKEEAVYGRMDPISTFQRTGRKISIAWSILNESDKIGRENMVEIQKLINFLYPTYYGASGRLGASTISTGPVLKLQYKNLAQNSGGAGGGLVGYLAGFTFDPVIDAGTIGCNIPKEINAQCEFTVLHTHGLGWHDKSPRTLGFPYKGFGGHGLGAPSTMDFPEDSDQFADGETEEEAAAAKATAAGATGVETASDAYQRGLLDLGVGLPDDLALGADDSPHIEGSATDLDDFIPFNEIPSDDIADSLAAAALHRGYALISRERADLIKRNEQDIARKNRAKKARWRKLQREKDTCISSGNIWRRGRCHAAERWVEGTLPGGGRIRVLVDPM